MNLTIKTDDGMEMYFPDCQFTYNTFVEDEMIKTVFHAETSRPHLEQVTDEQLLAAGVTHRINQV